MKPVMSLVGFKTNDQVADFCRLVPDVHFELSYLTAAERLAGLKSLLAGKVASVHACCPQTEFFPNLSSADPAVLEQGFADLRLTLETALAFGAKIVVLHTGYVTDRAMPRDYAARKRVLDSPEFAPFVADAQTAVCLPDYVTQDVYKRFACRATENLAKIAAEFRKKGVLLAAENLNPRVGYLFQTPAEMCALASFHEDIFLCLDVGHLYIASLVFGFDFLAGMREILATGKVVSCHLHSNPSTHSRINDAHQSLDKNNFPYREIIALLKKRRINPVLEVIEEFERNTHVLQNLLDDHAC